MSRKKEKNIVYKKMWDLLTELRGKIDGWDFKNYSLTMIFYKFFCEYFEDKLSESYEGPQYRTLTDEETENIKDATKKCTGVFIKPSELFCNLVKDAKKNTNLNIQIKKAFDNLQESSIGTSVEKNIKGIFDDFDVSSSKLGNNVNEKNDTLAKLMISIDGLTFDKQHSKLKIDSFGDMYEYLMGMYAASAGKSGGEYFTPSEASMLNARIATIGKKKIKKVYDPACGSGSLLLKVADVIGTKDIEFYGQELNNTTYNLCRENMLLHNIDPDNINIFNGDTLLNPAFEDDKFDIIVSNPPYSTHWETNALTIQDKRFSPPGVLAPDNKADYAFVMHSLSKLSPTGTAGIVLPHGVLFRSGNEGIIRKYLIENNHIETIIGLPANIFFGTTIPTIIMVLQKERTDTDIFFVDASKCFEKDKNQNVLRDMDIEKIYEAVYNRKDIDGFARLVKKEEVVANDYNLNIPRYVSSDEKETMLDLYSLMSGKIFEEEISSFNKYFDIFENLKDELFEKDETYSNYYTFKNVDIEATVNENQKVKEFKTNLNNYISEYEKYLIEKLIKNIDDIKEKPFEEFKAKLFETFSKNELIDVFEIFQVLSENIDEIFNDVLIIQDNSFDYCKNIEPNMVTKKIKKSIIEAQEGNKGTILPFESIKEKYLQKEFEEIKELTNKANEYNSVYTEILEGLEEDLKNEVCKLNKEGELDEENLRFDEKRLGSYLKKNIHEELKKVKNAIDNEKKIAKEIKEKNDKLDKKAEDKLKVLTKEEIEECLKDKWIKPIIVGIKNSLDKILKTFIKDIKNLSSKYSTTINDIETEIASKDSEIVDLLSQLTGSDSDIQAVEMLKDILK